MRRFLRVSIARIAPKAACTSRDLCRAVGRSNLQPRLIDALPAYVISSKKPASAPFLLPGRVPPLLPAACAFASESDCVIFKTLATGYRFRLVEEKPLIFFHSCGAPSNMRFTAIVFFCNSNQTRRSLIRTNITETDT